MSLILDGALGSVKGCSHLGDCTRSCPGEAQTRCHFLLWNSLLLGIVELAHEHVRRQTESRSCLAKRKYTVAIEAPPRARPSSRARREKT